IVVGYLAEQIKQKIGDKFGNMKIKYVENNLYDKTNTSYSLWLALKDLEIEDKLLILEGDVFFEKDLITQFISNESSNSTVVQNYNPNFNGSFVELKENKVIDWIHKTKRYLGFILEDKFKTVNIHKFNKIFIENYLKPVIKKHVEESQGIEPIEYVMQDIVKNKKGEIHAFEVGNLKWFEIDDLNDLKIAEQIFK
ncbi:MAG TPA: hypothetical protein VMZ91_04605, partial [Candidatus Paceibacterota bacterium]|nr:hypothetical protein [Candidatus Paceibacterota bacterium]